MHGIWVALSLLNALFLLLPFINASYCYAFSPDKFFFSYPTVPLCERLLFPMRKWWFSIVENYVLWCREAVCSWVLTKLGGSETGFLVRLMKKTVVAVVTCSLALGGATVGTISGAIKGQTTETGFLRGAGIGAVAGAITVVQLMELMAHDEPFSKVALLFSVMNGEVFREWVTPAVLKAYQWQVSGLGTSFSENSDIFDIDGGRGLSQDYIKKLPKCKFNPNKTKRPDHVTSCIVCLENFKNGEFIRVLQSCGHSFHLQCIDDWLTIHGSCPVCRGDV